ncbi:MAG: DUF4178 domain-containing protein [Planctomycetales bacterium]|nr:DUF4178 domain-containing protein [Planctomycetales bacterium]
MRHACPSCRTLLEIVHPTSEAVVCAECRTIAQAAEGTLVSRGKTGPFEPPLPLPIGASARFPDGEWTLLGAWRLIEAGYFWDTLTLGSPGGELRYLGYDRHRFRWHRPVPWTEDHDRLVSSKTDRLATLAGSSLGGAGAFVESGSGKMIAAAGELPWAALPDEITDYWAFERLTLEVTRGLDLSEASRPETVPHGALRAAFRLPLLWKRLDWAAKGGLRLRGPSVERVAATMAGVVAGGTLLIGGVGYAAYRSANPGLEPSALEFDRAASADSRGGHGWVAYVGPDACAAAWGVAASDPWGPWQKRTLIASLARVGDAARPLPDPAREIERAARGAAARWPDRAALVVDLPGPSSVALGAALAAAGRARPVLTFNNWPHQLGLVKCERTLAALLTFAGEVEEARRRLPADAPPALLLERERMLRAASASSRTYDNRYGLVSSDLPGPGELAARGIRAAVYVAPGPPGSESDDLNEWFLSLAASGVAFRWGTVATDGSVALADWRPAVRAVVAAPVPLSRGGGSTGGTHAHRVGRPSRGFFG